MYNATMKQLSSAYAPFLDILKNINFGADIKVITLRAV